MFSPDLDPVCLTLMVLLKDMFLFKNSADDEQKGGGGGRLYFCKAMLGNTCIRVVW